MHRLSMEDAWMGLIWVWRREVVRRGAQVPPRTARSCASVPPDLPLGVI